MNNITIIKTVDLLPFGWFNMAWCSDVNAAHKVPGVLYGYFCPGSHVLYYCKAAAS